MMEGIGVILGYVRMNPNIMEREQNISFMTTSYYGTWHINKMLIFMPKMH